MKYYIEATDDFAGEIGSPVYSNSFDDADKIARTTIKGLSDVEGAKVTVYGYSGLPRIKVDPNSKTFGRPSSLASEVIDYKVRKLGNHLVVNTRSRVGPGSSSNNRYNTFYLGSDIDADSSVIIYGKDVDNKVIRYGDIEKMFGKNDLE